MTAGRKRRLSTVTNSELRRAKNLGTRRTTSAVIHRDIKKLATAKKNKRVR